MKLLIRWGALAASFWAATSLVAGIHVDGGLKTYLWVALLFGLINALLGGIIRLVTLPITLISFGLFLVIINAAMLQLTARWSDKLTIDNFWSAIWASLIISVVTSVLGKVLRSALP
jgi:putative membrane protein